MRRVVGVHCVHYIEEKDFTARFATGAIWSTYTGGTVHFVHAGMGHSSITSSMVWTVIQGPYNLQCTLNLSL